MKRGWFTEKKNCLFGKILNFLRVARETKDEKGKKTAIFIDLANSHDLNFQQLLDEVRELGHIEVVKAYGDFRQQHLERLALNFYAHGIDMVHCPSWINGDNSGKMKRSDDRLLEKGIQNLLIKSPLISTYILVTADADIIPACHSIRAQGKRLIIYNSMDEKLGWIFRLCRFEMRTIQPNNWGSGKSSQPFYVVSHGNGKNNKPISDYENFTKERLIREIAVLEKTSRYLSFMKIVNKLAADDQVQEKKLREQLSNLVQEGVMKNYSYQIPAIKLNRAHLLVERFKKNIT